VDPREPADRRIVTAVVDPAAVVDPVVMAAAAVVDPTAVMGRW
jgi:hypothetical protein